MSDCCKNITTDEKKNIDAAELAAKKYPGPSDFTHLHVHTLFSTLDGVASADEYISRAKHFGMNALAVTDHGSLAGLPDAFFSAQEHGIKFIPGIEAYLNEYHTTLVKILGEGKNFADISREDKELASRIRRNRHLIVLAKNNQGFKNLLDITADSWDIGFYYKPRMWMDTIVPRKEGLIILSGCLNGPISFELKHAVACKRSNDMSGARAYMKRAIDWIKRLKHEFAEDFYMELQMPGPDLQDGYDILKLSIDLAKKFNIKTVISGDCHYLKREDFLVQRAMMAVGQKKTLFDEDQFIIDTNEGFMKSRAEFRQTFYEQEYDKYATIHDIELACDNTMEVAAKCSAWTPNLDPKLPEIENADRVLRDMVYAKLSEKGFLDCEDKFWIDGNHVTYKEQAEIELERIIDKGYSSYFLITRDLINHSREIGYPVGPGRGSAGGCLVSYLLGIHDMNPCEWGLSFNRFLSPARGGKNLVIRMD